MSIPTTFESGLFSLMSTNSTLSDFWGTDNNNNPEYQVFYLGTFEPVQTPPYCIFWRHKRIPEIDLDGIIRQTVSGYYFEIYHTSSWLLIDLQDRVKALLESLPLTNVGGIYVQKLEINDDFHVLPQGDEKLRLYKGVLDVEVIHNPGLNTDPILSVQLGQFGPIIRYE